MDYLGVTAVKEPDKSACPVNRTGDFLWIAIEIFLSGDTLSLSFYFMQLARPLGC